MPNRDRHRRADTEGRKLHHQPSELEHYLRETFKKVEHRFFGLAGDLRQRNREDYREHNHFQHVIVGGAFEETFWKYMLDDRLCRLLLRRDGLLGAWLRGEGNTYAWPDDVDCN